MLIWKIIGIALAVVLVGGIILNYAFKRNILNIRSLFFSSRKKNNSVELSEFKLYFDYINGAKNINEIEYDKNTIKLILKKKIPMNKVTPKAMVKTGELTYIINFENHEKAKETYDKFKFSIR